MAAFSARPGQMVQMPLRLCVWKELSMKFSALAAAGALLAASLASAATVPLPNTLDQLIASGATVTIGDKTFSNFSVAGGVAADQIHVVQAPGTNVGVEFQFNWSATDGDSTDTLIRYQVHVNDINSKITGVGLHFDGTTDANNQSLGNNATVTETISNIGGTPIGQISTFNAGPNFSSLNRNDATLAVSPTSDLLLAKDIMVHSVIGSDTATISLVDNTFQQTTSPSVVPLPPAAVMGFASILIGSLVMFRRRIIRI
jgi:hypothetical protein